MAHETHNRLSESSSTECGDFDIAEEIEWACTRLEDTMRDETAAYESLESLFKRRREEAVEAVKKAQSHLQFVNEEEARLRKKLDIRLKNRTKITERSGQKQVGATTQPPHSKGVNFMIGNNTSQTTISPLHSYMKSSQSILNTHGPLLKETEGRIATLGQLIAKCEKSLGPNRAGFNVVPIGTGKHADRANKLVVNEAGQPATIVSASAYTQSDETCMEDICVLRERLEQEESLLSYYADIIKKEEIRIATYRRLLAAETS